MAVVKEIKSGDTVIRVHDNYCKNKTEQEAEEMIKTYARVAVTALELVIKNERHETA